MACSFEAIASEGGALEHLTSRRLGKRARPDGRGGRVFRPADGSARSASLLHLRPSHRNEMASSISRAVGWENAPALAPCTSSARACPGSCVTPLELRQTRRLG